MSKEFLRRNWNRHSKLGRGRKKKQRWKKPRGRDNKMREKRKGYPKVVSTGYKNPDKKQNIVYIQNLKDLEKIKQKNKVLLKKVGKKKKIEIAKKAKEKGIKIENLNINKLLKKMEKENKKESSKTKSNKTNSGGKK